MLSSVLAHFAVIDCIRSPVKTIFWVLFNVCKYAGWKSVCAGGEKCMLVSLDKGLLFKSPNISDVSCVKIINRKILTKSKPLHALMSAPPCGPLVKRLSAGQSSHVVALCQNLFGGHAVHGGSLVVDTIPLEHSSGTAYITHQTIVCIVYTT